MSSNCTCQVIFSPTRNGDTFCHSKLQISPHVKWPHNLCSDNPALIWRNSHSPLDLCYIQSLENVDRCLYLGQVIVSLSHLHFCKHIWNIQFNKHLLNGHTIQSLYTNISCCESNDTGHWCMSKLKWESSKSILFFFTRGLQYSHWHWWLMSYSFSKTTIVFPGSIIFGWFGEGSYVSR